jgi:hypothetical protein
MKTFSEAELIQLEREVIDALDDYDGLLCDQIEALIESYRRLKDALESNWREFQAATERAK